MNASLILTKRCNLRCRYCFEQHEACDMSEETALRAMDFLAENSGKTCGVSFFGGEPLLRRELIVRCVERARQYADKTFSFNMTTNGLLLDEDFLSFACDNNLRIALSHDGLMSADNRVYADGKDCLSPLNQKLALLLRRQPDAFLMATVSVNTAGKAAASVRQLAECGVQRLNLAIDARPDAGWDDAAMNVLDGQLGDIEELALSAFREGRVFHFQPFEEKILAITKERPCHVCRLGKRKLYMDADGAIYPCIQFGGVAAYRMGDVWQGVDPAAQEAIYRRSLRKPSFCEGCALAERCVNDCACVNYQQCGEMGEVSPVQCRWQRMLIAHADSLARRMLQTDEASFIKMYMT